MIFCGKSDEYRTSALCDLDNLPRSSFVRLQTAVEICFVSRLFHIFSRRKVRANTLSRVRRGKVKYFVGFRRTTFLFR